MLTSLRRLNLSQKREISLGYNCSYTLYKDGYRQTDIIINHVAVVEKGRAGPKVAIQDNESVTQDDNKGVKSIMRTKNEALAHVIAAFAKDAKPEEVVQALSLILDKEEEEKETEDKGFKKLMDVFKGKGKDKKKKNQG